MQSLNRQPWPEAIQGDLQEVEQLLEKVTSVEYLPMAYLLQHTLLGKGKRLRPALVLLSAKFHNYRPEVLVPTAAAIELLHTATLVHDDLIDNAGSRRGSPTLNTMTSVRATVLVGDYLFAQSAILAVSSENIPAMKSFSRALVTICDGELREVLTAGQLTDAREEYYRRIDSKTAALFSAATEVGGILSDAPESVCRALAEYGHGLGMAFQIVDDVLDFVGDERQMGKPVGNDLRQGTLTLPVIYLMELYPDDRSIADMITTETDREEKVRRVVEMVNTSPAVERSYAEARRFISQAQADLQALPDNEYRQALMETAEYVVGRRQ